MAHEKLLDAWVRLKRWIGEYADDLRLIEKVCLEATDWDKEGRARKHLWSHEKLKDVSAALARLGIDRSLLDEVCKEFIRPEAERLLTEFHDPETPHNRRAWIGDRLAEIGDPRPGVALRDDGTPDIAWIAIPSGDVEFKDNANNARIAPFCMSRYLVTNAQFHAFVDALDGYCNPEWWEGMPKDANDGPREPTWPEPNRPRENVSWYEAIAFCRWLSKRHGLEVRLPTALEWQQAATGGTLTNVFPWGQESDTRRCNTKESTLNRTTAVGIYPSGASAQTVLDLAGNVWEWCFDNSEDPHDQGR